MSRPSLVLDDSAYRRQSGHWIDTSTGIRVPQVLASRLDSLARTQGLWPSVQDQDRLDHPQAARPASATSPKSGRLKRIAHSRLEHEFLPDRLTVRLWANVRDRWRPLKKVVGFCEEVRLDAYYEHPLRIQVKVLRRSGSDEGGPQLKNSRGGMNRTEFVEFLDLATHEIVPVSESYIRSTGYEVQESMPGGAMILKELPAIKFRVEENELSVWIELFERDGKINAGLRLKQRPGKYGQAVQHVFDLFDQASTFPLQVLVVAQEPPRLPVPDSWERLQKGFVHGGRPGSKRTH